MAASCADRLKVFEQLIEASFVGRERALRLVKQLLHGTVEHRATRLVAIFGAASFRR
jgi:hypothetical protein